MTGAAVAGADLTNPAVQRLLGRSALYEVLALALAYPESEVLERLRALTADLAQHEAVDGLQVAEQLAALRALEGAVEAEKLAPVHFALFDGSVLCSPHETEYIRDGLAKAAQLADIAGFYAAFGLRVSSDHHTVPDYIATELEFMALLTRKEAYAAVQGWSEEEEIAGSAGRAFLKAHLGRWAQAFAADLRLQSGLAGELRHDPAAGAWYRAVADLLAGTIRADMVLQDVWPSLLHARVVDGETAAAPSCPLAGSAAPGADVEIAAAALLGQAGEAEA